MKTTSIQRRNNRMHAMFERASEHDKQINKLPLQYAAGSIGNSQRGCVAMLPRGSWGYDDATGKLFAAAPDMLAALEMAYQEMFADAVKRGSGQHGTAIQKIASAINKAKGHE